MEFESILWLENSKKIEIDRRVINDLNLVGVYERLLSNDEILYSLIQDIETIQFRQDIMDDFMNIDGLMEELIQSLESFYELKSLFMPSKLRAKQLEKNSSLYRIIDILIIIEKSIDAVEELNQILYYYKPHSHGLKNLKSNIEKIISADEYNSMKKDLKEIKYIFKQIKSATLSVNMNVGMRPVFAQVTSLDEHHFNYPKAFRRVSDVLKTNPIFLGQHLSTYVPVFKVHNLNYDLMEEIEFALSEHREVLTSFITKYNHVEITPFMKLLDEVQFYYSSVTLFKNIKKLGLPFSKPELVENEVFIMDCEGFYNINLAMVQEENQKSETIILNDLKIDKDHQSFIITGANRGGKTTFTQGVGHVFLLAQLGLFVPCKALKMTLSNGLITHFPVVEKETYETGKFGKECELFVKGYKKADKKSLYLLNESFTGTSHLESLNTATQGCMAMIHDGIPFVFNTHLHKLFNEVKEEVKIELNQDSKITSLVTDMEGEQSTYKLIEREPYGKSYARSIASKYGVTYEQLVGEKVTK